MADAQAEGPGSTSSQAQIGFKPDESASGEQVQSTPFRGGGTASAQSGRSTGQSQSQIQGRFNYGISYTGAAQAASGSKDGVQGFRKLPKPDGVYQPGSGEELNKRSAIDRSISSTDSLEQLDKKKVLAGVQHEHQHGSTTGLSQTQHSAKPIYSAARTTPKTTDIDESSEYDDEYDDEYGESSATAPSVLPSFRSSPSSAPESTSGTKITQSSPTQTQHIVLGEGQRARVVQDPKGTIQQTGGVVFQPGETVGNTGYVVPQGFRGRLVSGAGSLGNTFASGGRNSQAQTATLATKSSKSYLNSQSNRDLLRTGYKPSGYVSVTKSESGNVDREKQQPLPQQKEVRRKTYEHTYYTKSSTCGYFTFSCNIVYGSNGRTKICKPKKQTNADGSPITC